MWSIHGRGTQPSSGHLCSTIEWDWADVIVDKPNWQQAFKTVGSCQFQPAVPPIAAARIEKWRGSSRASLSKCTAFGRSMSWQKVSRRICAGNNLQLGESMWVRTRTGDPSYSLPNQRRAKSARLTSGTVVGRNRAGDLVATTKDTKDTKGKKGKR